MAYSQLMHRAGMHPQVFLVRCHADPLAHAAPVRNALTNWRRVWAQRTGIVGIPEELTGTMVDSWKRVGFARHAVEFWSLTNLVLLSAETSQSPNSGPMGDGVLESLCAQLLSRYDESDMGQVHHFVHLFDNMSVSV